MYLPDNDKRPLFSLTIGQFNELTKRIVSEEVKKTLVQFQAAEKDIKSDFDFCGIEEACRLTNMKKATMYSKISKHEVPVSSRQRPLIFSKKQLTKWLELGRPKISSVSELEKLFKNKMQNV